MVQARVSTKAPEGSNKLIKSASAKLAAQNQRVAIAKSNGNTSKKVLGTRKNPVEIHLGVVGILLSCKKQPVLLLES